MKIRISDAIDEDTNNMKNISNINVSKRKIKAMVLNEIKAYDEKKSFFSIRIFRKSILIAIAAIFMTFTITSIAANYSESFKLFLTEGFDFMTGKEQIINLSDTNNGIIMTVEAAISDDKSATTLVKFTKIDGSDFDDNMRISNINLSSETGGFTYSKQKQVSDDKKSLFYLIKTQSYPGIVDKKITLLADNFIINEKKAQVQSNIDIDFLYNKNPLNIAIDNIFTDVQNFSKELLIDQDVSAKLEGIAFESQSLYLYYDVLNSDLDNIFISYLLNEKTGNKINAIKTYNYNNTISDNKMRKCAVFENIDKSQLAYLKIVTNYSKEIKTNGKWSVDYKLEKGENSIEKIIDTTIQSGNDKINISKININMLGIFVEGIITDRNGNTIKDFKKLDISMTLENGEIIKLLGNSMEFSNDKFILNSFTTKPINLSKIVSLTIDDKILNIK